MVTGARPKERERLQDLVTRMVSSESAYKYLQERVDVTACAVTDWSFPQAPDAIFVGKGLVSEGHEALHSLRRTYKQALILAEVEDASVERLQDALASGAGNVFSESDPDHVLLKNIVVGLERARPRKRATLLVVDGGKGGIGCTTVAAGIAATLAERGLDVGLLDMDYESQDLTRYLAVKPFMNEPLDLLLAGVVRSGLEPVSQSVSPVDGFETLSVAAPAARYENLLRGDLGVWSRMKEFLEVVNSLKDVLILDVSTLPRYVARKFYEVSDGVVYVVSLNPATVHSALARIRSVVGDNSDFFEITLACVEPPSHRLRVGEVQREFARQITLGKAGWTTDVIPFDPRLAFWPGSSRNLLEVCRPRFARAMEALCMEVSLLPDAAPSSSFMEGLIHKWKQFHSEMRDKALPRSVPTNVERIDDPALRLLESGTSQSKIAALSEVAKVGATGLISGARISS
jgi:MinD-like ATPase involved in chromosome partitioning or flagellar assembly